MTTGADISQLLGSIVEDLLEIRSENDAHVRNSFNVFSAMRSHTDEVKLHSRFIASILDPSAPHGLGTLPLKSFLDICGLNDSILSESRLSVIPNYYDKAEAHEIDIFITTKRHAIIVENKINHSDTNYTEDLKYEDGTFVLKGQLERYYDIVIKQYGYNPNDIYVVYLTKDGHCPSNESVGQSRKRPIYPELKEKVISISYGHHILQWLHRLEENCSNPDIVSYLNQYSEIVEEMTESSSIEERKKLVKLIGSLSEDKKDVLCYLYENAKHILWHNADEFWHSLIKASQEKHNDVFYGIEMNGQSITDTTQFDSAIGNALTKIISNGKEGDFKTVYRSEQGVTWYISMDTYSDSLFFCVLDKYKNRDTGKERKMPQSVLDYLDEGGYEELDNYFWKYYTYGSENIRLPDSSCKQTLMLTRDEYRLQIITSLLNKLRGLMAAIDEIILSSNAQ